MENLMLSVQNRHQLYRSTWNKQMDFMGSTEGEILMYDVDMESQGMEVYRNRKMMGVEKKVP